ncbi:protein of unknown function [Candidatus Filomicrobium marinum]|uniref:Uncharacterized protein n=1 Tax=Candidatus Filomicrobium marinum TaxID=1608628 RepID=A0A0D6JAL2_9HYPH|nr:protein of unknown function [Candidatus Filomicrobium marinum]CPR15059.1 protein of unknown function [Candidatus Filomicrobium marinum]
MLFTIILLFGIIELKNQLPTSLGGETFVGHPASHLAGTVFRTSRG